jgi:hypothetical protein
MGNGNRRACSGPERNTDQYMRAIAAGYGFRETDLMVGWDIDGTRPASTHMCTVVIATTVDGAHTVNVDIDRAALITGDSRRYLWRIEAALSTFGGA